MTCGKFETLQAGKMTREEFARHARECKDCAEGTALDARLDAELAALRETVPAPGLWERIEAGLGREKARAADAARPRLERGRRWAPLTAFLARKPLLAAAGAVALAAIVLGAVLLILEKPLMPSGILARRALANVEMKEREYAQAITALERQAGPKIEAMDLQMGSLYRDKLATINAQIEKCREALASNPGNAHIRRYLLAALRDKREALADALGTMN
jgi:hypothetical protein